MDRPVVVDLFAGCGGMSLGLEAAGFDIGLAVEIDPIHALIHHVNFPYGATLCKDISHVTTSEILTALKQKGYSADVDVIAGGPPCQGFSHMGKRQLDDPRNKLVFEYLRIVRDIQPKYFIFENVPGITSGKHKKFLEELMVEFEKIGYVLADPIRILDAVYYGAPQKRKRLILLGSRRDVSQASYPVFTHSNYDSNSPLVANSSLASFSTVGDAIGDLAKYPVFTDNDQGIPAELLDYSDFRQNFALTPTEQYKLCHQRKLPSYVYGHIGSKHTEKSIDRFRSTLPGQIEKTSRFLKLAIDGQCNTLRAGTSSDRGAYTAPRPIHYGVPRCISVREAARLHTFPDWFRFHNTIWHGFREIGNAVIPFLAKQLGDQIMTAMKIDQNQLVSQEIILPSANLLNSKMAQAAEYWSVPGDTIPKRRRIREDVAIKVLDSTPKNDIPDTEIRLMSEYEV